MPDMDDGRPAPGDTPLSGPVKWFDRAKGYGFVLLGKPGRDAFLHVTVLRKSGFEPVAQGDLLACTVEDGPRGLTVARVTHVERTGHADGESGTRSVQVVGRVKFYCLERGFGFVRDDAGREVFVGSKLLKRLSLAPLRPEQAVKVTAVPGESGLVAETLTFV